MRKMLNIFISLLICYSITPAQVISGNYELDSLVVKYVTVVRDTVQVGTDNNTYTTEYDHEDATYEVVIGWPRAGASSIFDFPLPYYEVGDTIGVLDVPLSSPAALDAFGLGLNTDFSSGSYTINAGSVYPTTNTVDCVTEQVFLPIQDAGTWTDNGHDPLQVGNSFRWGWGIITSNVFASFDAPNMNTGVYGTDYGMMADGTPTAMPNWGYIQANYTDNTYSVVDGLNIGWEAHDGPDANLGIVSDGDPYFNQAEADLGLLNGMVGRSALPSDSVTILAMAQLGASLGITVNVPDVNPPYMLGGPGAKNALGEDIIDPNTGDNVGAFDSEWGYVFDPTGDLLGGGDGLPFSGDEALQFTGYYATWNTLITLNGVKDGVAAAIAGGALTAAGPNIPMLVDSVLGYTLYYWDISEASQAAIEGAGAHTTAEDSITSWLSQGYGLEDVGNRLLPFILGTVTAAQAQFTQAGAPLTYADGSSVVVDDSGHDLDSADFQWDNAYYYGELWNNTGGRLWVQSYANCFPAKWSQYVDSHWRNTAITRTANVQIIHNSASPTVDVYVDGAEALGDVAYRTATGVTQLPAGDLMQVGIAPADAAVIATFPFYLEENASYVVMATGLVGDTDHPFTLKASGFKTAHEDNNHFALKIYHGATDAPAVDLYANGTLLVTNLSYGEFTDYLDVPVGSYTIDVVPHGTSTPAASFTADLSSAGGGAGIVYASGFLNPPATDPDAAFSLVLTTPSGGVGTELPATTPIFASVDEGVVADKFELKGNYPNPFNPTTKIRFSNDRISNVKVTIYSLRGEKVATLMNKSISAGTYDVTWNGKNSKGSMVPTGMYLYNIESDKRSLQGKMLLLK